MKLKVVGTGSKGNAYLLENGTDSLLIECGVNIHNIKRAMNFNMAKVRGCIVTHEHKDHSRSLHALLAAGVDVWATRGTHTACGSLSHHRSYICSHKHEFRMGAFKVLPFNVKHDAEEPVGFLINHPDSGNVLFMTDTFYCPYKFDNLNNILIEANYDREIMRSKLSEKKFLEDRILQSHMSIETCLGFLDRNDLSEVNNIILIHLSDGNSHEQDFKDRVERKTGKRVTVADNGLEMELNRNPF
jgi:phosphoribosyl 1,2-cyclic phosphodiesterase